jgi:LacI family transcriptional regulator
MPPTKKSNTRKYAAGAALSKQPPRVALIVETSTTFGRRLLSGIAQYMRESGPWSVFFTDRAVNDSIPPWIVNWDGDGIISRVASPDVRSALANSRIPVVDLNEQMGGLGVPLISNDHAAIGRMAARHLIDRGFRNFAYLGHAGHPWSDKRQASFAAAVKKLGHGCDVYSDKAADVRSLREGTWETEIDRIASWASVLTKPVGLMACNDFRALQLLSACRLAGVAVPEEAAVIGVGADEVACELSNPPLSSVTLNASRMGYEAAVLLDKLMKGKAVPRTELLIPPVDVSVRRSTDVTAIDDPVVAKAVRFIREHACDGINVETVLQHIGVSRTWLQARFRAVVQKSVHDVLIETRMARVKELLAETAMPLEKIAERCGFQHPEYMSSTLKQRTGWSPAKYRREFGRLSEFASPVSTSIRKKSS